MYISDYPVSSLRTESGSNENSTDLVCTLCEILHTFVPHPSQYELQCYSRLQLQYMYRQLTLFVRLTRRLELRNYIYEAYDDDGSETADGIL